MNKHFKLLITFIFIGFLSVSCGSSSSSGGGSDTPVERGTLGGGGDSDDGGGSGNPTTTVLLYKSGSISAIDPANPSAAAIVVEAAGTNGERDFFSGTLDIQNKRIDNILTESVVYGNTSDGKLYKISTLKSNSQNPVQISSETGASLICETDDAIDWSDPNNSQFLYKLPGGDGNCNNADDIWKMTGLNASSSDAPLTIKKSASEIYNPNTGRLEGFLALENKTLEHCDLNFQNCVALLSFFDSAEEVEGNFSGDSILRVDNRLFHYNSVSKIVSSSLHTFSSATPIFVESAADETTMYFVDDTQIFSLPMDGSSSSLSLVTEIGVSIPQIKLTSNTVAYITHTVASPPSHTIKTIGKSGGAITTLIPTTSDSLSFFIFTAGDLVFYNRDGSAGLFRGLIQDDGSSLLEVQNAIWSGVQISAFSSNGFETGWMIWTEGCSSTSCAGGVLKSIDATNNNELMLGTLPDDIPLINFVGFGAEDNLLGSGVSTTGFMGDIFLINPSQANSLSRITNTPNTNEEQIGF